MTDLSNMSREELLEIAKQQAKGLLHYANHPAMGSCPFCLGSGLVPLLKTSTKGSIMEEWSRDVTPEEYEAHAEHIREAFKPRVSR